MRKNVDRLFEENLKQAQRKLSEIRAFCGEAPEFSGLSGWVFEKTMQHLIRREFRKRGIKPAFCEQVSLEGHARIDLTIDDKIALEIKSRGLFSSDAFGRYRHYRAVARKKGFRYLYVTLGETYLPYRRGIIRVFGRRNAFFLDRAGEWRRFIETLCHALARKRKNATQHGRARRARHATKSSAILPHARRGIG